MIKVECSSYLWISSIDSNIIFLIDDKIDFIFSICFYILFAILF